MHVACDEIYCKLPKYLCSGLVFMRGGSYGGRLSRSLEFKVSQCLEDYRNEGQTDWSVATLYEYCQKTDASLRRIKKRQLEGIIEKG